jgi:hypothetical protein
MIEIRRLLVDGYSYDQIMHDLHIPRRTFSRYLHLMFEEDKKQLNQINQSEVIHQFSVMKERLNTQYRETVQLAKESSVNGMARVKARNLASELALVIFRLYTEMSPALMAVQLPRDNNHQQRQQPQQQSQQKILPPPPSSLEDDRIEDDEEKDEKDNSSQSGSLGQTEKPDNTIKPAATEPKVCDSNDMPEVQRINGLRVIKAPLEDMRNYNAQQIQDGYCYRFINGEKVHIDLSDIKAMKEKVRREAKDNPTTKTDAEYRAKWTRYY